MNKEELNILMEHVSLNNLTKEQLKLYLLLTKNYFEFNRWLGKFPSESLKCFLEEVERKLQIGLISN